MLQINAAGFAEAIKSDSPVFIKIFASWCSPCKLLAPIIEKISEVNKGVAFLEMDVDKAGETPNQLQITNVPTMVMFRAGAEVGRLTGFNQELVVQNFIDKYAFQA